MFKVRTDHVQAGDSYLVTGRSLTGAAVAGKKIPCPFQLCKPETTRATNPRQQARPVTWEMTLTASRREARYLEGPLSESKHRVRAQVAGALPLYVCI